MVAIIIAKPLITLSSLIPATTKPLIASNLKTLNLKKLHSLSNGVLCSTTINAAVSASKAKVSPFLTTLASNPTFVSGLVAWVLAQSMKVLLNLFVEKRWDLGMLVISGGMPSSHSALCMALTTSVALVHGVGDSLFPVCLGFNLIVMYDAIGVRRHAGMQAQVKALGFEHGRKILCPVASVVDLAELPVIPNFIKELEVASWIPIRVTAYETRWMGSNCVEGLVSLEGNLDAILFTSTAEVEGLLKGLDEFDWDWGMVRRTWPEIVVGAHGPVTAKGAERLGVIVDVVSEKFSSFDGVVDALEQRWGSSCRER